jgi:hypothetical protein
MMILLSYQSTIFLSRGNWRSFPLCGQKLVNPVRNSSGALNPAGIILKSNPAAEQRGIISNGVKIHE